jgi:hypothetical protein
VLKTYSEGGIGWCGGGGETARYGVNVEDGQVEWDEGSEFQKGEKRWMDEEDAHLDEESNVAINREEK